AFRREAHPDRAGGGEGEVVLDALADPVRYRAGMARRRLDADRRVQIEELENRPEAVVAHIGDRTAAEFVPAAEVRMGVVRMVRAVQRRTEPQVPVETRGNGRPLGRQRR